MNAVFHAAYEFLALGIGLKLLNFPFIFFIPGYVSISGADSPLLLAATAFAGPCLNLILWLGSWFVISRKNWTKKMKKPHLQALHLTKQVNMLLFILNMLPIPGFDGFSVYLNLYKAFF
jgi:Zn-dependent protease